MTNIVQHKRVPLVIIIYFCFQIIEAKYKKILPAVTSLTPEEKTALFNCDITEAGISNFIKTLYINLVSNYLKSLYKIVSIQGYVGPIQNTDIQRVVKLLSAERKHVRQKAMAIFEVLEAKKLVSDEIRQIANIDGGHRKTDDIHISVDAPDMSDQEKERNEETSRDIGRHKDLPALQVW